MAIRSHGVISFMGSTGVTDYGYIQSFNCNDGGSKSEALDNLGNVVDVEYFNGTLEASMTYIPDDAKTIPSRGDVLAVTHGVNTNWSGNYIVESVSSTEGNSDRPTVTITAMRYTANGIPA